MKRSALILSAMIFAGCAHFQPQPIAPEKTAAQWGSRRLDDDGLKKFLKQNLGQELKTWPEKNWDLPALTLVAFFFHPSLDVARAQWLVAQAGLKTAGARPNPSVTVTPGYDTQIPGNYSPWLVPVTFDWPWKPPANGANVLPRPEKLPSRRAGILSPPSGRSAAASAPVCLISKWPDAGLNCCKSSLPRNGRL